MFSDRDPPEPQSQFGIIFYRRKVLSYWLQLSQPGPPECTNIVLCSSGIQTEACGIQTQGFGIQTQGLTIQTQGLRIQTQGLRIQT